MAGCTLASCVEKFWLGATVFAVAGLGLLLLQSLVASAVHAPVAKGVGSTTASFGREPQTTEIFQLVSAQTAELAAPPSVDPPTLARHQTQPVFLDEEWQASGGSKSRIVGGFCSDSSVAPLWPGGLVLLVILAAQFLVIGPLGLSGEDKDWANYEIVGAGAIVLLVGMAAASLRVPFSRIMHGVFCVLGAFCLAAATIMAVQMGHLWLAIPAAMEVALYLALGSRELITAPRLMVAMLIAFASWTAASTWLYWTPLDSWIIDPGHPKLAFGFALICVQAGVAGALRTENALPAQSVWGIASTSWRRLVQQARSSSQFDDAALHVSQLIFDAGAFLLIVLSSMRRDNLMSGQALHNWSVYIGPAQSVQHGGWLLWDVPSQYGFLNILVIAHWPASTPWQSMYILTSGALAVSGCLVYFVFRHCGLRGARSVLALLIAIAGVFLMPGWIYDLAGPAEYPSVDAFRFIWACSLLVLIFWEVSRHPGRPVAALTLWMGTALWLIGTLWSAESAVYCSATWLPAYCMFVLQRRRTGRVRTAGRRRSGAARPGVVRDAVGRPSDSCARLWRVTILSGWAMHRTLMPIPTTPWRTKQASVRCP